MTDDERTRLIRTASGEEKADLVIKNATVADVFGGGWLHGDVAVTGGRIAGVGSYSGKTETDGSGKYVLPAFYDAHLHFESVMVRPSEYLKRAVPRGVTSFNADPHEIANVLGLKGIKFMMDDVRGIPADVHFMMPSCVPATPEDMSGCVLTSEEVKKGRDELGAFGLGEKRRSEKEGEQERGRSREGRKQTVFHGTRIFFAAREICNANLRRSRRAHAPAAALLFSSLKNPKEKGFICRKF